MNYQKLKDFNTMRSTTTLNRFLKAWQNNDAKAMNRYTLNHMQGNTSIERYKGWFETMPKINFENINEVATFDGIVSDVQVDINGKKFQFRLMKETGKFQTGIKGQWRINPGSMRKI